MRTSYYILVGLIIGAAVSVGIVIPGEYAHTIDARIPDENHRDSVYWLCPVFDESGYVVGHRGISTCTGISYDDFKKSWNDRDHVRKAVLDRGYTVPPCPKTFLDNLGESISSVGLDVDACTDRQLCLVIQSFVVNGIGYAEDMDMFGCEDFALTPLETLYLGRGDCEDVSILFVSIARAYGLDAVLMLFDGHCTAGVRLDGYTDTRDGYVEIECTFSWAELYRPTPSDGTSEFKRIVTGGASDRLASAWARYSNRTMDWNPILFIIRTLS